MEEGISPHIMFRACHRHLKPVATYLCEHGSPFPTIWTKLVFHRCSFWGRRFFGNSGTPESLFIFSFSSFSFSKNLRIPTQILPIHLTFPKCAWRRIASYALSAQWESASRIWRHTSSNGVDLVEQGTSVVACPLHLQTWRSIRYVFAWPIKSRNTLRNCFDSFFTQSREISNVASLDE